MLFAAGAIGIALYFGVFNQQDLKNLGDQLRDGFGEMMGTDPFAGSSVDSGGNGTVYRWRSNNGKGGLKLEILNALDDDWQPFFAQAVSDWESGTPDALSLSTTQVSVESACSQVEGKMKVCNGNYGDTGWRGINELILTSTKKIVSSVAKMNTFYLDRRASNDDKQYTMCHEIGHGFGLPHTDENFMNNALGNCLDYSNNPSPNLKPGQINFDKLVKVYGEVGSQRLRGRNLAQNFAQVHTISSPEMVPERAKIFFHQKVQSFRVGFENDGWVLLRRHPLGEVHAIDIGDGYHGHVNILLAHEQD